MKLFKQALKYGSGAALAVAAVASHAAGTGPVDTIFAAIDLTTVAASVLGMGVLIIGVAMAFKGVDLGKRGVKKV